MTPLSDNNQKVSVYHTMLAQFRRALEVMTVRRAAKIKIRRACFMHPTIAEVDVIVQPTNKRHRGNNYTWYDNKQNEDTMLEFYDYHNRYDACYAEM